VSTFETAISPVTIGAKSANFHAVCFSAGERRIQRASAAAARAHTSEWIT
jgi:hypothetical protein